MNLYQVTWPKGGDYGSFVVCCENEDIARRTHPGFYVVCYPAGITIAILWDRIRHIK